MSIMRTIVAAAMLALVVVAPSYGQHPSTPSDPHHPDASKGSSPSATDAPSASMPMDMCRQMMGDMMGMPMTGGTAGADPKERAAR